MARKLSFVMFIMAVFILLLPACRPAFNPNPDPIPVWEDTSADSATLSVTLELQDGTFLPGGYVNLALSPDSLSKNLLVRRLPTDGRGKATFSRLYPRKFYGNCSVIYLEISYYGNFRMTMPPQSVKDTIVFVH